MKPLGPTILVFCLIFLPGACIALLFRRGARRRESKIIERAGVGAVLRRGTDCNRFLSVRQWPNAAERSAG